MANWYGERNWALSDMLTLYTSSTVAMFNRIDDHVVWSIFEHAWPDA